MSIDPKDLILKSGSKGQIFETISNVDPEIGYSDVVQLDLLEKHGLKTINGGDWCRDDGPLGNKYIIRRVKLGKNKTGRITAVQLMGYKKNIFPRPVPKKVRNHYKNAKCALLCIGRSGNLIEVDHKDGRYDVFKETPSDNPDKYQPLHKCVNDAKRTHCKNCSISGIRFDARLLGYSVPQWIGTEEYMGNCVGCFWYDHKIFNHNVSESFVKTR